MMQSDSALGTVVVVGAGVVGIATALSLRRQGFAVTLVDRGAPGEGCSFGNAGMIQTGSSLPIGVPGLMRRLPRMLFDPEGPLSLRWRHLPGLLPWGARLVAQSSAAAAAANERLLAGLLREANPAWDALTAGSAAAGVFRARGELYVVRSAQAFAGYAGKIATLKANGIAHETLDAAGLHALEPLLAPDYTHGLYLPESRYVVDPLLLSQRLLERLRAEGGRFERREITGVQRREDGITLTGPAGELPCARLVVAAGAGASRLGAALGLRLPVEPLRGYHVTLPEMEEALSGPVIEGEMNIAVTPMTGGNRVAGTIEFAGHSERPNWRRAEMLVPMARRMVPALAGAATTRWSGDRPGTPDSLPVLGPAAGDERVWFACGHGMLGLTLAARSGEMIAAAMAGLPGARAALAPFGPDRFTSRSTPRHSSKEQA
ncbi:FAD-binding oxidoreductase [Oceanicella sp. SM1341]|uniref:NAD(P)/FAD-dependent oxidoreductase n=1 Tax=Oceanicella sp. SM1341 TaxID=1548889 RepID=UPI000E47B12B|nr:FAD-dependent oxidoreductase [Oceanicella sp. SM1341]